MISFYHGGGQPLLSHAPQHPRAVSDKHATQGGVIGALGCVNLLRLKKKSLKLENGGPKNMPLVKGSLFGTFYF